MKANVAMILLCLFYGTLAVSVMQHRGTEEQASLAPTDQSQPTTPATLLEVGAAATVNQKSKAKLNVLRSIFPQGVTTSSTYKNAQELAVESTGPPPLSANWGIVSDPFGKGRLNMDYGGPTLANAIAIQNGQGCYYGCSQFRLYGSNVAADFSNFLYPGISSSMYPLGMYQPTQWTGATPKCDAASAATFNPTEQIITLEDEQLSVITKAGGFQFYIFLFDDTYGSTNPSLQNYFSIKHIAIQTPRVVPDAYPFYKFVFTQTRSQASASTTGATSNGIGGTITSVQTPIQLAEVRMWTDLRWVQPVQALTTNPGGYWTTNFEPIRATDNLPQTAWRDNNMQGQPSELHLVFSASTSFTFYEFVTAVDEQSMDPSSWTLFGSQDQHAWITLDVRTKFDMPTDRGVSQKFEIDIKNYPTSVVFVGGVGSQLQDQFLTYLYSVQPGVPGLDMYKDPSNSLLTDGQIVTNAPQTGLVAGWPTSTGNVQITFNFGNGKRANIIRFTFGHIKYVDYALGPPNAVTVELSYDQQGTWTVPTRWQIDPGSRTREVAEIPLQRAALTAIRLTFIPGTYTFNDDAQTVANKWAIDEVTFYDAPDPCGSAPCSNNAGCNSFRDQFSCSCTTGFSGSTCSSPIDRCTTFPQPCLNGGTCVFQPPPTMYSCNCISGFEGSNCESVTDPCAIRPCGVNGTCSKIGFDQFKCTCNPGYTGTHCVPQADIDGQIPTDSLESIFQQLDARVVTMEDAGDALLAAKLKMEKQRAQILAQGRETYRNILGLEQSPSVDPNSPPGSFETLAASLYGAGGGPNGGLNFPSPGEDSLLGGDASYYPEVADPIYGTDPNGVGPGVAAQVDPYQSAQDPNSLISLYTQKQSSYDPNMQKESLEAIMTASALANSASVGTPQSQQVYTENRAFPIQTPNVANAGGPLLNQPYSGGPSYIAGVGGPGGLPVNPPNFNSLDTMIKNLEQQLKVPNTIVYLPNNGISANTNGLIETSSSVTHNGNDNDDITKQYESLLAQLQATKTPSRALLSLTEDKAQTQTQSQFIDLNIEETPEMSDEEKAVAQRLKAAQAVQEKHRIAEQSMMRLEEKLSKLQSRMETDLGKPDPAQESYLTSLLTTSEQIRHSSSSEQQQQQAMKAKKEAMTAEELNSMEVLANRPFPRSGPAKFLTEYQHAFPGLDNEISFAPKLAKPERIARASPAYAPVAASPTPVALLQTDKPAAPPSPAEQHALLEKTLQALIQTRSKMLEEQQQKQIKARMDALDPKTQEKLVRHELMSLMGDLSHAAQPMEPAMDTSLAELGGHSQVGQALPGLGAMDVMAAAEDPNEDQNDGQLAQLASIAESLSAEIPKVAAKEQTPDQKKAAAALKRAKELKYLTTELNVLDPDHKIGDLPEDGRQW